MTPLFYALAAPIIGVFLYPILHDNPKLTQTFDRCMYVGVPILILIQVFGHSISHHGWEWGGLFILGGVLALGLFLPIGIEKVFRNVSTQTEALSIIAGFLGVGLHALIEGASLNSDEPTTMIPIAVHRIAVGLMIWWILFPRYGLVIGINGIVGLLLATVCGFLLSDVLPQGFTGSDQFQAFVSGSLLHVIFHESYHGSPHAHTPSNNKQ